MNRQDRYDAIHILEDALHSMGNATLGTWCVKGSAMHKLQSAIRYLDADLRDHAEQYDELNDADESTPTASSHFEQLKAIMDQSSVDQMLLKMSRICYEKSEHIESNWQDKATARVWRR